MSTQHQATIKAINEMKGGLGAETIAPRTQTENSSQVAEPAAAPAAGRRNPAQGVLIERQFQRRNNINSLPGLIREHARLIALMRSGEISLDKGEILSRAYARHKEMVSALEQRTQLAAIEQQLKALRGEPPQQLLIDEAAAAKDKQS
jgi:hypothetical protein